LQGDIAICKAVPQLLGGFQLAAGLGAAEKAGLEEGAGVVRAHRLDGIGGGERVAAAGDGPALSIAPGPSGLAVALNGRRSRAGWRGWHEML